MTRTQNVAWLIVVVALCLFLMVVVAAGVVR